jgi:uncharacterized metal-binding protein
MEWIMQFVDVWGEHIVLHFALAFCVGLLGFLPMLTTSLALCSLVERLTRSTTRSVVVYGILLISILAGLALALLSHWALDAVITWYQTPLGPSLDISG